MSNLKFRAWLKKSNQMFNLTGFRYLENNRIELFNDYISLNYDLENVILMQSTGLEDENSIEIYEGDILYDLDGYVIGVVKYVEGIYICGDYNLTIIYDKCHVAGNIYENEELFKINKINKYQNTLDRLKNSISSFDYQKMNNDDYFNLQEAIDKANKYDELLKKGVIKDEM